MTPTEIAIAYGELRKQITLELDAFINRAGLHFEPDTDGASNEEINNQAEADKAMANYLVISQLASEFEKKNKEAKIQLDEACRKLGLAVEAEPGEMLILNNGNFQFSKKQNKPTQKIEVKDLIIQLSLLNVEKSIIDKALNKASSERKGNTYYIVSGVE